MVVPAESSVDALPCSVNCAEVWPAVIVTVVAAPGGLVAELATVTLVGSVLVSVTVKPPAGAGESTMTLWKSTCMPVPTGLLERKLIDGRVTVTGLELTVARVGANTSIR